MNIRQKDRVVLLATGAAVIATAAIVVVAVVQAGRSGTRALEQHQLAQVQQLTRSMDSRVVSAFEAYEGFVAGPVAWHAKLRDAEDAKRLADLQAYAPQAKTGMIIVDATGVVTNATLLRDPASIGRRLDRPGLDRVLAGTPSVLPVAPGITTSRPTIGFAYPLRLDGRVVGAFMSESEVAADSAFNEEISQLRSGRTGGYMFVDELGTIVASSDTSLLGTQLDEPLIANGQTGFHRGDGRVVVAESVPAAGWRAVFRQDAAEFQGALTGPLRSVLLLVLIAGVLATALALTLVARRLRRSREEQRRLSEIASARTEFVDVVSHELRAPVAGLVGFLQATEDHWDALSSDEQRRAITRSLTTARRLQSLSRDVVDASMVEEGALTYDVSLLDLRDELTAAVDQVRSQQPERAIHVDMPTECAWVSVDAERMRRVIVSVLDNALRSSAPLSPVEVTMHIASDTVSVRVTDHGAGLSAHDRDRLFEKFARGRSSGTSLGLHLARELLMAHGGTVRVESDGRAGASVIVELPLLTAPKATVSI